MMDALFDSAQRWFGTGADLSALQMTLRAAAIFFIALVLIRVSGRRSFGQRSPFDSCVAVLLGAVLSRAVVGASPFLPIVAASAAIVLSHRLLASVSCRSAWFDTLINGRERVFVTDGVVDAAEMRRALVTAQDLAESIRKKAGTESLDVVKRAVLERNGEITIATCDSPRRIPDES